MYEDAAGNTDISDGISVCVDNVQILDDLRVLDGADLPEEWEAAVAGDGTLKQNHLSYVKSGDGENTLDKVVNEAAVNQKLVYAQVTYTNNTDAELRNILYHGSLITMKHEMVRTGFIFPLKSLVMTMIITWKMAWQKQVP